MLKSFLLIIVLFFTLNSYGQNTVFHYIRFFHVGEKIQPVNTLNISYQNGRIHRDSDEKVIDTLPMKSVVTDEKSYDDVLSYIKTANFKLGQSAGKLYFGTFKVIAEGKYFYLPGNSVTSYFKKLVTYLKKKKSDPELIQAIVDNYPWIFNP